MEKLDINYSISVSDGQILQFTNKNIRVISTDEGIYLTQKSRQLFDDQRRNERMKLLNQKRIENLFQSQVTEKDLEEKSNASQSDALQKEINSDLQDDVSNLCIGNADFQEEIQKNGDSPNQKKQQQKDKNKPKKTSKPKSLNSSKQSNLTTILQHYEWMNTVPSDFGIENWIIVLRPVGQRCLVVKNNQLAVALDKEGNKILQFTTALPFNTILDCIYNEALETLFILDTIIWKGTDIHENPAELRFFMLETNFYSQELAKRTSENQVPLSLIQKFECSSIGLISAYNLQTEFTKDGLLFYEKNCQYICNLNPFFLLWKDENLSQFLTCEFDQLFIYTTLQVVDQHQLQTLDGYHIQLQNSLDSHLKEGLMGEINQGDLIKLALIDIIDIGIVDMEEQEVKLDEIQQSNLKPSDKQCAGYLQLDEAQIQIVAQSSVQKCMPDPLSQIIFLIKSKHQLQLSVKDISIALENQNLQ